MVKNKSHVSQVASVMSDSLQLYGLYLAHQTPLSMGFFFPGKNSGVSCPALFQGIKPASLLSPALASGFFSTSATWEAHLVKDPSNRRKRNRITSSHKESKLGTKCLSSVTALSLLKG